jgi:Zn-dependent protease
VHGSCSAQRIETPRRLTPRRSPVGHYPFGVYVGSQNAGRIDLLAAGAAAFRLRLKPRVEAADAKTVLAAAPFPASSSHGLVLTRWPLPIVVSRGAAVPGCMLGLIFALCSMHARPVVIVAAAALGAIGGTLSLIVHELGHVSASRRLRGLDASRVSLIWMGAATHFEGKYRTGREQARVALGGPVASLVFAVLLMACMAIPMPHDLKYGAFALSLLNVAIAFMMLLPVHPLDGHKVVVGVFWAITGSESRARGIVRRVGFTLLAFDVCGTGYLLAERPLIGAIVVLLGAGALAQRRLVGLTRTSRRA